MTVPEISRAVAPVGASSKVGSEAPALAKASGTGRQELVDGGKEFPRPASGALAPESIQRAAELVEQYLQQTSRSLRFAVDADSGVNMFTVLDSNTGEVVRQVPSEEVLAAARYITEHAGELPSGALLNTKT